MNYQAFVASLLMLASLPAIAAEVTREVSTPRNKNEAYAEVNLSLVSGKQPLIGFNNRDSIEESNDTVQGLNLALDARLQYKRFFIDFNEDSFSNLSLGVVLTSSDQASVELIASNLFNDIKRNDVAGLESINKRKGDLNIGIRSSTYRGNNVFQFELMGDVSDAHSGVVGAVHVGKNIQIRNWNLHGLLGVRYFSDDVIDHYFGVSSDEATASIAEYVADDGVMPSVQIGASLPINEKWVFKTKAEYSHLPDSVSDSPLAQGDSVYSAQIGFAYVFGGR